MAHFWNRLGKVALVAAPYIAAPFTGGASLALTGAANAAEQRWAQHDAEKAIARGEAPSQFDRWLGIGASAAGLASGVGALGGALSGASSLAGSLGNAASTGTRLANIGNLASGGLNLAGEAKNTIDSNNANQGLGPSSQMLSKKQQAPMPAGKQQAQGQGQGYSGMFGPNFGMNQNNPNLALSIDQGRMQGLRDVGQLPPVRFQRQYGMSQ